MNAATPNNREWPVIRVFVSSTFTDFNYKRDALHQKVFRKLEPHCCGTWAPTLEHFEFHSCGPYPAWRM